MMLRYYLGEYLNCLPYFSHVFILSSNTHEQNRRSASHGLLTKPSCITSKCSSDSFTFSAFMSSIFLQNFFFQWYNQWIILAIYKSRTIYKFNLIIVSEWFSIKRFSLFGLKVIRYLSFVCFWILFYEVIEHVFTEYLS